MRRFVGQHNCQLPSRLFSNFPRFPAVAAQKRVQHSSVDADDALLLQAGRHVCIEGPAKGEGVGLWSIDKQDSIRLRLVRCSCQRMACRR
jgi:hypothetical protein